MVNYIIPSAVRHPQAEVGSMLKLERRCPRIVDQPAHKICLAHWRKSKCKRARELHCELNRQDALRQKEGLHFSRDFWPSRQGLSPQPLPYSLA